LHDALVVERAEALPRQAAHVLEVAELDRLGGARLGARRGEVGLESPVTERALLRDARLLAEADDVVRAGRDAVPAAVADVRLDVDGVELRLDDRVGRADLHARRERAVLAHVAHHRPGNPALRLLRLDEPDVPPVLLVELPGVVVAVEELRRVPLELVPLLAGDLARLAPDTEGHIGEEPDRPGHLSLALPHIPMRFGTILCLPCSRA